MPETWAEKQLVVVPRPSDKNEHPGVILMFQGEWAVVITGTSSPRQEELDHPHHVVTYGSGDGLALNKDTYFFGEHVYYVAKSELRRWRNARPVSYKLYRTLRALVQPVIERRGQQELEREALKFLGGWLPSPTGQGVNALEPAEQDRR